MGLHDCSRATMPVPTFCTIREQFCCFFYGSSCSLVSFQQQISSQKVSSTKQFHQLFVYRGGDLRITTSTTGAPQSGTRSASTVRPRRASRCRAGDRTRPQQSRILATQGRQRYASGDPETEPASPHHSHWHAGAATGSNRTPGSQTRFRTRAALRKSHDPCLPTVVEPSCVQQQSPGT